MQGFDYDAVNHIQVHMYVQAKYVGYITRWMYNIVGASMSKQYTTALNHTQNRYISQWSIRWQHTGSACSFIIPLSVLRENCCKEEVVNKSHYSAWIVMRHFRQIAEEVAKKDSLSTPSAFFKQPCSCTVYRYLCSSCLFLQCNEGLLSFVT